MNFREATTNDIEALHRVRLSVKENVLNNPALVTESDYRRFLTTDGKGWLCETDKEVTGFAIVDTVRNNVWALFVHPQHEQKGIGKQLQRIMLNWFFSSSRQELWLTTGLNTRAEIFYNMTGWKAGAIINGERKFTMSYDDWKVNEKQTSS